jgi:hypothetical protein
MQKSFKHRGTEGHRGRKEQRKKRAEEEKSRGRKEQRKRAGAV